MTYVWGRPRSGAYPPSSPVIRVTAEGKHARTDGSPCSCNMDAVGSQSLFMLHPELCPELRSIWQELREGSKNVADGLDVDENGNWNG